MDSIPSGSPSAITGLRSTHLRKLDRPGPETDEKSVIPERLEFLWIQAFFFGFLKTLV
jgi:hypothetical protein